MQRSHLASHCARRTSAGPTGSAAARSVAASPSRASTVNATARIGEFRVDSLVMVVLLRPTRALQDGTHRPRGVFSHPAILGSGPVYRIGGPRGAMLGLR